MFHLKNNERTVLVITDLKDYNPSYDIILDQLI